MKPLYFVSTLADKGVSYRVSDGDRTWQVIDPAKLPPNFVELSEFDEIKYVTMVVKQHNPPAWVVETLAKFLQTIR